MKTDMHSEQRKGYCPVFDLECPSGPEASSSCGTRFTSNYNPLTRFRDADIEHCAIYRQEQAREREAVKQPARNEKNQSAKDGE